MTDRPVLTLKSIRSMSPEQVLDAVAPMVLEPLPEGVANNPEALLQVDSALGRLANSYAYLIHMHAAAGNEVKRLKVIGDSANAALMIATRDNLYELARAVKLKHDAASRMITVHQEVQSDEPFDRVDYKAREAAQQRRAAPPQEQGTSGRSQRGWMGISG